MLLLSNSLQHCHRAVAAAAVVAAVVDSLVGSGPSNYRQIHLIYTTGEKEKR